MRSRDGGLVVHGVRAMKIDKAAQWLLRRVGDRWYGVRAMRIDKAAQWLLQRVGDRRYPKFVPITALI